MKPVWLLDIDGVINAYNWLPSPNDGDFGTPKELRAHNGFLILYFQEVMDFLTRVKDDVEIRWHTTWQNQALQLAKDLKLPEFAVQTLAATNKPSTWDIRSSYGWWKLDSAIEVAKVEERKLIWTDDDLEDVEKQLFYENAPADWQRADYSLLITPSPSWGLTKTDLDEIEAFIETCKQSA